MVVQRGHGFRSPFPKRMQHLSALALGMLITASSWSPPSQAQSGGSIKLIADVQEADANTCIITARGNVRIDYPVYAIYPTSAQSQYYLLSTPLIFTATVFLQHYSTTLHSLFFTYLIPYPPFL